MNIAKKNWELAVLLALIFSLVLGMSRFDAACDDLRTNVLRLHIIANSDSKEDQELKLLVRDKILEKTGAIFEGKTTLKEAEEAAMSALTQITDIAQQTVYENGKEYLVSAQIGDSYFENREYEDFTLPAGTYRSLIVNLGEGEGKNWWCVVFPSVCIPASSKQDLTQSAQEYSAHIAETPQKYVMRFKSVELYEEIKRFFKNK